MEKIVMRSSFAVLRRWSGVAAMVMVAALTACGPQSGKSTAAAKPDAPKVEPAEYTTETSYFQALQKAALAADYAAFAGHLKAANPQTIVTQLQQSFGGRPFDVYTAKTQTNATAHKRALELRGTGDRLYVYLQLEKVTGGWNVGTYQIERDRRRIVTRL